MTNLSKINSTKKLEIVQSVKYMGIEKVCEIYGIDQKYIKKWATREEKLKHLSQKEKEKIKNYSKKHYSNLSEEKKKIKSKYCPKKCKTYSTKHCIKILHKSMVKNLKQKKYAVDNLKVSPFDLWLLAKKQKLKCAISGIKLDSENISVDHITPLSRGGSIELSNLQLVTKKVNYMKSTMDLNELVSLCRKIVEKSS